MAMYLKHHDCTPGQFADLVDCFGRSAECVYHLNGAVVDGAYALMGNHLLHYVPSATFTAGDFLAAFPDGLQAANVVLSPALSVGVEFNSYSGMKFFIDAQRKPKVVLYKDIGGGLTSGVFVIFDDMMFSGGGTVTTSAVLSDFPTAQPFVGELELDSTAGP